MAGFASAETLVPAPWWGITTGSRPTDLRAGVATDEVQELKVSATKGDMFLLDPKVLKEFQEGKRSFEEVGQLATIVSYKATAEQVQKGLEKSYPSRKVVVTPGSGPGDEKGTKAYVITFPGQSVEPIFAENVAGAFPPGEGLSCEGAIDPLSCTGTATVTELSKGKPDGQIVVEAENLGNGPASGCGKVAPGTGKFKDSGCTEAAGPQPSEQEFEKAPVTITDRLPQGLTAVSAQGAGGAAKLGCVLASAGKVVTCTYEGVVSAYEQIEILISVHVEPGAKSGEKSGEVNVATVSGGGAAGTRTATHEIEIDSSPSERFGIENYTVVPENVGGTVDTQAGSHPFQLTSVITANSAPPSTDQQSIGRARTVALVKDNVVELPAGMVGNPTPFEQCTDAQFGTVHLEARQIYDVNECPASSAIGVVLVRYSGNGLVDDTSESAPIFNMVPLPGEPARFAFRVGAGLIPVFLDTSVRTGSDYGVTISSHNIIQVSWLLSVKLTFWGVPGSRSHDRQRGWACLEGFGGCPTSTGLTPPPFLIMPTSCEAPFSSTLHSDSWAYEEHPSETAKPFTYTLPEKLDGCNHLPFTPSIEVKPDVPDASASTGLTVGIHLPQTAELNPEGLAESSLRNTTVTLPAGVAVNPSGANGLEACSGNPGALADGRLGSPGDQIGYRGLAKPELDPGVMLPFFTSKLPGSFGTEGEEALLRPGINFCANGSKIGTVKIKLPVLPNALEGSVYLADQNQNPFGSLVAMYAVAEDPVSGVFVKLAFNVSLDPNTGQLVATSENSPQGPLENAEFHFFGGERAPLATPSRCGAYTTQASFTPWSAEPGEASHTAQSTFNITSGPNGSACTYPGQALPFKPTLTGGATNVNSGVFSPFTATMSRKDGEQNLQSLEVHLPPGLSGILTGVELCPEPQANLGECGPNSLIGETTISVGVGSLPFSVSGGKFYLTGPYNGSGGCKVGEAGCAPFGVTFEVPAKAGPFDLKRNAANPASEDACDCVIVRGKIEINPQTAAITITSNPPGTPDAIPTSIEGIPLEIQHVNAITTRGDFQFNPTNCSKMEVTGTIHSSEGGTDTIGVPFQVTNCAVLAFKPGFKVSTSGKTSRANGTSLSVKLTYPKAPFGSQANVRSVKVDLPKQLPSRLTTLQKACTAAQFEANPAGCPADSIVGHGTAITPLIPVPLTGPAYFVSYGGAKFPELVIVLQGYNVTLDLHGETFISKAGITSSTFHTIPDAPVGSFELTLPEGKYSALAANGNLCKSKLEMPTAFVAQNGAEIKQSTPISVTGCKLSIEIVRHSVKGATVTIAANVPSAGKLVASGASLSRVAKSTGKAGTLSFSLKLSASERALLKSHPGRKLKVTVKLLFTPAHGQKLSAGVSVNVG
jgi:hypothetical protein